MKRRALGARLATLLTAIGSLSAYGAGCTTSTSDTGRDSTHETIGRAEQAQVDTFGNGTGIDGNVTIAAADTVVNSYTGLTADAAAGATVLNVGSTTGFGLGALIMVWQPTGLEYRPPSGNQLPLDLTGSVVGTYELARVQSVSATTITLTSALVTPITFRSGRAQAIRVMEYNDLTINAAASIAARAWDGTTGGIAAFLVAGNLSLAGRVHANARGFRGGPKQATLAGSVACPVLGYDEAQGAAKGESVVAGVYPTATGRGNVANGGGGGNGTVTGNCHDTGGGGGSNAGAGGRGGLSVWNAVDNSGYGGSALAYTANGRLVMGGGGGAGRDTDNVSTAGATGGGVVWVRANAVSGAGRIEANGATAATSGLDGAGGGGAGGTVHVVVTGSASCTAVDASGGAGGNVNYTGAKHGPGGGGGAGNIHFTSTGGTCPRTAIAGSHGTTNGTNLANYNTAYAACFGTNGSAETPNTKCDCGGDEACVFVPFCNTGTKVCVGCTGDNGAVTARACPTAASPTCVLTGPQTGTCAPDTTLTAGPTGTVTATTASLSFTSAGAFRFECSLDGAPYQDCTSPRSLTGLADGPHTFNVRAVNGLGVVDPTPATRSWVVDTTPPPAPVIGSPTQNENVPTTLPTLSGTAESGATVRLYVDGSGTPIATVTAASGNWTYTLTSGQALALGGHTLTATATDAVNNVSPSTPVRNFNVVQCLVSTQCSGNTPVCSSLFTCVACNSDFGGSGSQTCSTAGNPYCNANGSCGRCATNSQCTTGSHPGPICNTVTGACGATCFVDGDCTSTQWCDLSSGSGICASKLGLGQRVPTSAGHTPPLTGTCTTGAALAVCTATVCSTVDNACGQINSLGCAGNTQCRSNVCETDGACGRPNGSACAAGVTPPAVDGVCRSAICFTDNLCGKPNDQPCAASAECRSVCVSADQRCGLLNGSPCTRAADCRSGVCNADGSCGDPVGTGCTTPTTCRTGVCKSNVCAATCASDTECPTSQYCNGNPGTCANDLTNGAGTCNRAAQCVSGVCNSDGKCGDPDGSGCTSGATCRSGACRSSVCGAQCTGGSAGDPMCATTAFCTAAGQCRTDATNGLEPDGPCTRAAQCQSAVCASDGKCGRPDGDPTGSPSECRSGVARGGICAATNCTADTDCAAGSFCAAPQDGGLGQCTPSFANNQPCARAAQCLSSVCFSDGRCGAPDGSPCGSGLLCRTNVCTSGKCGAPASVDAGTDAAVDAAIDARADATDATDASDAGSSVIDAAKPADDSGPSPTKPTDDASFGTPPTQGSLAGGGFTCAVTHETSSNSSGSALALTTLGLASLVAARRRRDRTRAAKNES